MNREQIMQTIRELAKSQGLYGRLYEYIANMEPNTQDEYLASLERQNFNDAIDLVLYFEQ